MAKITSFFGYSSHNQAQHRVNAGALHLTQGEFDKIVDKINNRLCKVLGYLTPYEVVSS
jgi:hypothetical protein